MYVHRKSLNINLEANWGFPVKPGRNTDPGWWELGWLLLLWLRGSKPKRFQRNHYIQRKRTWAISFYNIKVGFCVSFAISHIALVLFPSNLAKTFHRVQRWAAWLRSRVLPPATAASFPLTEDFLVPGPRLFTITSGVISSDLINFPSIRNASKTTWTPHALHPWTLLDHLAPACSWSAKKKLHIWPQIAPARNSPHPENLPDEKSRSVGLMTVDHYFDSWWLNIPNLYSVSAPDLWRGPNCMLVTALLYKSTYFDFDDCQVPHWGAWPDPNLTVWSPQVRFPNSRGAWPLVTKWQQLLNFLDSLLIDSGICLHMQPVHGLVYQPNQCV